MSGVSEAGVFFYFFQDQKRENAFHILTVMVPLLNSKETCWPSYVYPSEQLFDSYHSDVSHQSRKLLLAFFRIKAYSHSNIFRITG